LNERFDFCGSRLRGKDKMGRVLRKDRPGAGDGFGEKPEIFFPVLAMSRKEKDDVSLGAFRVECRSDEAAVVSVNTQIPEP